MKSVGAAARDIIDLHAGLPEALIEIHLIGLDGHFLNIFYAWADGGGTSCPEILHAAALADHSINVAPLCATRKSIPSASFRGVACVSGDQTR